MITYGCHELYLSKTSGRINLFNPRIAILQKRVIKQPFDLERGPLT
jgi:hypothetical protein